MAELSEGLDLSNLDATSEEEIRTNLMHVWSWRGPLYEMQANSLMLDYAPDFAKLHRWASDLFGRPDPEQIILLGIQNFHSYMMYGWETGIRNQFISNRRNGLEPEEIMELVSSSGSRPHRCTSPGSKACTLPTTRSKTCSRNEQIPGERR